MTRNRRTVLRIGAAALGLIALAGCSPAGLLNGISRVSGDGEYGNAKQQSTQHK